MLHLFREIKLSQTQRKEIFHEFDFQTKFLRLETSEETENKKYNFCVLSLKKLCSVFGHKKNFENKIANKIKLVFK